MAIEAKIAHVLTNFEVAFNVGAEAGVEEGGTAWIFRDTEVTDPDTGEPLGVVRRPQIQFRITEVQPKLCVGTTVGQVRKAEATNPFSILQEAPQRVRVTTDPASRDYRTRVISLGAHVEIEPPSPDQA